MEKAFTMIELVFIIVILGILAAIAIPKLNANRISAEAAKIANNLATCIDDAGNAFMKTGHFSGDNTLADSLPADSVSCNSGLTPSSEGTPCFNIIARDSLGTLQVSSSSSTTATCKEAQNLASHNGVNGTTHNYNF